MTEKKGKRRIIAFMGVLALKKFHCVLIEARAVLLSVVAMSAHARGHYERPVKHTFHIDVDRNARANSGV